MSGAKVTVRYGVLVFHTQLQVINLGGDTSYVSRDVEVTSVLIRKIIGLVRVAQLRCFLQKLVQQFLQLVTIALVVEQREEKEEEIVQGHVCGPLAQTTLIASSNGGYPVNSRTWIQNGFV